MNNKNNTAVIYYTIISILSITFCSILTSKLEWPALAEIPLAVAIFIHLIVASKILFKFLNIYKERVTDELINSFKAVLFELDTKEEEINI